MGHHTVSQPGGKSHCRFGRKKLRRQRTGKANHTQGNHHQAHLDDVPRILIMDTGIDEAVLMNGDVDGNGELDIIDVTYIQRYLAFMDVPFPIGEVK